jgi:hypothetical protein
MTKQIYDWEYESVLYVLFGVHATEVLRLYPPTCTLSVITTRIRNARSCL